MPPPASKRKRKKTGKKLGKHQQAVIRRAAPRRGTKAKARIVRKTEPKGKEREPAPKRRAKAKKAKPSKKERGLARAAVVRKQTRGETWETIRERISDALELAATKGRRSQTFGVGALKEYRKTHGRKLQGLSSKEEKVVTPSSGERSIHYAAVFKRAARMGTKELRMEVV